MFLGPSHSAYTFLDLPAKYEIDVITTTTVIIIIIIIIIVLAMQMHAATALLRTSSTFVYIVRVVRLLSPLCSVYCSLVVHHLSISLHSSFSITSSVYIASYCLLRVFTVHSFDAVEVAY